MIQQLIQDMEAYAKQNNVPIMQEDGLRFMSKQIEEHNVLSILEVGTAIGYSAIRMAMIDSNIQIVSIERDEERYMQACQNVEKSGLSTQIKLLYADALEVELEGTYDMIFIDAAKAQYIKFFENYSPLLKEGGIIVSDNLQFHGMVEDMNLIKNRNTKQLVGKIKRYIAYLKEHPQYDTTFYDCGDGVAITKKKQ